MSVNREYKYDDVTESPVQYDYGFRIYDSCIAKFLSVDPLTKSYSILTPYQFASNRPIDGIDVDGLEAYAVYYYHENNGSVKMELVFDSDLLDINIVYERHFVRPDLCIVKSEYGIYRTSFVRFFVPTYVSYFPNF